MSGPQPPSIRPPNPYRPGAGHMPPFLAGRGHEAGEFRVLLGQDTVLKNFILTGLRGLGKTVLLDTFKPAAIESDWLWAGTDFSESTSISEETLAIRLLTDLSLVSSSITWSHDFARKAGFVQTTPSRPVAFDYASLAWIYESTPGLVADKLKAVLETVWPRIEAAGKRGLIFAYDEAQNLSDHSAKQQYPLALLLDVFQSIQRKGLRIMLVLTGLPTLFPKLVEARTFAERMFHIVFLNPLTEKETTDAIRKPVERLPIRFTQPAVKQIWDLTRGYPYFVQYVCREAFDLWIQTGTSRPKPIPVDEITRKLDADFFAGRWARATDRQRDLLRIIAHLSPHEAEFSVQAIVEHSANRQLKKSFSGSHVNQMLVALSEAGLVYKNRHGRYSFAVPLLGDFIRRQNVAMLH